MNRQPKELGRDKAYECMLADIMFGELPPGGSVDEKSLALRYGIGLASVREALYRLSLEGMIERISRRGTRIAALELAGLHAVFEARVILEERCAALATRFAGAPVSLRVVPAGDDSILDEAADIFAPNALGAVLNPRTIPRLKARIVCGAANNQLEDETRDDRALNDRGILYVPDFVANRMGIVNCANEQYGSLPDDPAISKQSLVALNDFSRSMGLLSGSVVYEDVVAAQFQHLWKA